MEMLLHFLSFFLGKVFNKSKIAQIYYYDPQSAGINLQSPQSDSTPWTLTLIGTSSGSSSRRRTPTPWTATTEEGAEEQELVRSLQLKNDARYTRMEHYNQGRAERYACGHVSHLKK